jgi:hypothetical protein
MHNSQILLISAAFAVAAFRLYQKFIKKNKGKSGTDINRQAGSSFPSSSKDDDYEPYSKK